MENSNYNRGRVFNQLKNDRRMWHYKKKKKKNSVLIKLFIITIIIIVGDVDPNN